LADLHFLIFFSLEGKLLVTSNIVEKNFLNRNLELVSSLCIIWFLSDRLFLLYKSSFEKTPKKRAFAIENPKKMLYDFLNSICGHIREKLKWPFEEFFRWFKTNTVKKVWRKNKFLIICRIRKFCSFKSCLDYETLLWWYIEKNI
jgi:hypothetical protein